ncbi:rhodanese-like domain-containing protein [Algibacter pacificus]|uniref:rhodanese-like domain-containing protein n=1 Tax=Algibacter pacificus TaxID=2599389 RepID=UPI0011C6FFFA|nr:rhodanese-like domain-containing protein [Algibacter pacificus]
MKYILFAVTFVIFSLFFNCKAQDDDMVTHVTANELNVVLKEQSNIQILDVRTSKEYEAGHLPNAENIDFLSEGFSKALEGLDKNEPLVIYCKSGRRSGKSLDVFRTLGFTKIYNLEGGILKWKSKGFEVN